MDARKGMHRVVQYGARIACLCLVVGLFLPPAAWAEIVTLRLEDKILATAEFRQGDPDKPALLMLHGFLQTRNFPTVARLADSLHELGFSVLTPTLSLGINSRASSLPCEAIQTHTLEAGVEEVGQWVLWLQQRGFADLVLLGHSAGSITEVAYLSQSPIAAVRHAILISLSYFGQGKAAFENPEDANRAQQDLADGKQDLDTYSLAFCRKYVAQPGDFLSYYRWSKEHTLKAMAQIPVPVTVVVGGGDDRMDKSWISELQTINAQVITVPGANHFFDQEHEFDLLAEVEEILDNL